MLNTQFLSQIINVFLVLIETSLSLRFLLKFFGANTSAPFTEWIYNNTQPLLSPFVNIFPAPQIQSSFTLEFTTLFAIVIYMILGYTLIEILDLIDSAGQRMSRKK